MNKIKSSIESLIGSELEKTSRNDQRAIAANCESLIYENLTKNFKIKDAPGKRSIYDFELIDNIGKSYYCDVSIADQTPGKYSDGGICSVKNLTKFLFQEKKDLIIIKILYSNYKILDIQVFSLYQIPIEKIRIENLGTGQIRLDDFKVDLNQSKEEFKLKFKEKVKKFYEHVIEVAKQRREEVDKLFC